MIVPSKNLLCSMNLKFTKFYRVSDSCFGQSSSKLKIASVEEMFFISWNRILLSFLSFFFLYWSRKKIFISTEWKFHFSLQKRKKKITEKIFDRRRTLIALNFRNKEKMHWNYEAIPFNFSERDEIVSSSIVFSLRIGFLVLTV